ncbi:hypothetical protein Tco_1436228 [Tanacetum coccineum]
MRQDLAVRLRMVYDGGDGQQTFVSHAWRRLFGIRGGVRRSMTWRQFILALGLHSEEEMAQAGGGPLLCSHQRPCNEAMPQDDCMHHFWPWSGAEEGHRHAKRRKSRARLSRGYFIGRLAKHFGLADEDAPYAAEGAQADPTPAQAPPPPPPPRTPSQRIARLEEEMHEIRGALDGQRKVIDTIAGDLSRFTAWAADGISHLLDAAGASYT